MFGAEISGRFGLPPNSLSYCGKPNFRRAFAAYLADKSATSRRALELELSKFTAHYAYLRLIAKASGFRPFDAKVSEALWIGNGLLRKAGRRSMQQLMLREFSGPGRLPRKKALALASSLPAGALPHHSFHALYVHTISGVIAPSVKNADSCMVHWGKVIKAGMSPWKKGGKSGMPGSGGPSVLVQSQKLVRKKGKLALVPCARRLRLSCAGIVLLHSVKTGGIVASHWGVAVMKLSARQARQLESVTRRNIQALNSI